ncbi:MAG: terminase [Epulopiscium sp. Nuni2H_MBin001]|nr:MAG: terminase [Epulopiscium sp. Nuni2H_MBin001]
MIKESKAYQYATWCLNTNKVGIYVKLQAQSWLNIADGKNKFVCTAENQYKRLVKILKLIQHPDLQLNLYECMEDYAWFLIVAIFCTINRDDNRRYYQTILLEISRKNFKTFYSAVIFIVSLLTESKFSRFFSVAPNYQLSNELNLAVKKIIKSSPALQKHFKINATVIRCKITDSVYEPLAYSSDKMDGKLATVFLADEAGAMDSYPIESMRSSQITLKNKLGIIISTQYPNDSSVLVDEIDISKKVLDGLSDNRRFSLLYEPDAALQKAWQTNNLAIYQANPVSVNNKDVFSSLIDKRNMAILYDNKRENFLCKHLNIKYKGLGTESYIDMEKLKECSVAESKLFWAGKDVYVGLDLSLTDDNTAVSFVCIEDDIVYSKSIGFIPKERIAIKSKKEKVDYNKLIKLGHCISCGDYVIDYLAVEQLIINLKDVYGVNVVQVGYDRYNALSTVQKLTAAGLECVEIKQHSSILHSPTKWLRELILSKKFRYEDNLMLEINFQNAQCTEDTNKNKYVNKKKSSGKVDIVVSLINALYLLEQEQLYGNNFVFQTF